MWTSKGALSIGDSRRRGSRARGFAGSGGGAGSSYYGDAERQGQDDDGRRPGTLPESAKYVPEFLCDPLGEPESAHGASGGVRPKSSAWLPPLGGRRRL